MWYTFKDPVAIQIVFTIIVLEMALIRLVPGDTCLGPVSPAGKKIYFDINVS